MCEPPRTDLKASQKDVVLDGGVVKSDIFEGNNGINIFPHLTATKLAWINVQRPNFDVFPIFGQKREGNFVPVRVPPRSSDDEGHITQALDRNSLYGQEKMVGFLCLKIMDC